MKRHWSINGRFLTQRLTGVQRYASEIVRSIDELISTSHPFTDSLEIDLLVPNGTVHELSLNSIKPRTLAGPGGHLWEQGILPLQAKGGLISLCNSGPISHTKHIVCIHDLNTRLYPKSYSLQFRMLYRALLPAIGRTAEAIATVSEFSAEQLIRYGICPANKIAVIPDGYEHTKNWLPRHSQKTRSAAGPDTVVLIGSLAPHKNIGLILGLADDLATYGLKLAVVGIGDERIFAATRELPVAANINWLGRLSDNELAALLRDSFCLVFPSLTEGFGLPVLEAMALGCPVVSTDRASLPEICRGVALFACPNDPGAWLERILRLRQRRELRTELISKGRSRAKEFSWHKSAAQYLMLMAQADRVSNYPLIEGLPSVASSALG